MARSRIRLAEILSTICTLFYDKRESTKQQGNSYLLSQVFLPIKNKRIGGVMVSVLALSAVDRGFESR